jgi:hypothetical protein
MAENKTPELGSLEQPSTKEYRVVGLGARYRAPQESIGADGKPTIVYVSHLAGRGETVALVEHEAKRLLALGVIREADSPLDGRTPAPSTADGPPSEGDLARGNEVPRPPERVREEADGDDGRRSRRAQRKSGNE